MGGTGGMNDITNLFSAANGNIQNGSLVYTYNPLTANWNTGIKYSSLTSKWASNITLPPGHAVYYANASASVATVITFVGQVVQGPYSVASVPVLQNALLGSPVPIGGSISNATTVVGMSPNNGDLIYTYDPVGIKWNSGSKYSTLTKKWSIDYTINPGQGFFYANSSASTPLNWTSNFTVQ